MSDDFMKIFLGSVIALCLWMYFNDGNADILLPMPSVTPGATRAVSVQELCTTSTKLVRHTTDATKNAVYRAYHITPRTDKNCTGPSNACYEIDHLISLEIGGDDVQANLWPQRYDGQWGAHTKDRLENELHRRVCANKMTLQEAQTCISTNWLNCYKLVFP